MFSDNSPTAVLDPVPLLVPSRARRRWKISDMAALITALVILSVLVVVVLHAVTPGAERLNSFAYEHLAMLSMVDTTAHRLAHRLGLVILAALSILAAAMTSF